MSGSSFSLFNVHSHTAHTEKTISSRVRQKHTRTKGAWKVELSNSRFEEERVNEGETSAQTGDRKQVSSQAY